MHAIRQRLYRLFVQLGGNLGDAAEVRAFERCIEGQFALLPPKVKVVVERAWFAPKTSSYPLLVKWLARQEGHHPTEATVRQRLSRGARLLEELLSAKPWEGPPRTPPPFTSARRPPRGLARRASPHTGR
jgi:hypothetical protein